MGVFHWSFTKEADNAMLIISSSTESNGGYYFSGVHDCWTKNGDYQHIS